MSNYIELENLVNKMLTEQDTDKIKEFKTSITAITLKSDYRIC